jgi:hypothetical protein
MRKLDRYVAVAYLKYYIVFIALATTLSAGSMSSPGIAYVALTPLACIATLALCCTVVELALRFEFETLQSFGVSLRRFAIPLVATPFALQFAASAAAVVVAGDRITAAWCALLSFVGLVSSFAVLLGVVWRSLDAAAVKACALGYAVQAGFAAFTLAVAFRQ